MAKSSAGIKKRLPAILLAVTIVLMSLYMVYWGTQKEGYFVDEMFSLMDMSGGRSGRPHNDGGFFNTWHEASGLESAVTVAPEDAFFAAGGNRNPYFSLLHITYSFRPGEFSLWPSLALNIVILAGSLTVIYLLSLFFIDNRYLALLPGLVWGLGSAAVNLTVYIRFYAFKTLVCLLLMYLVLAVLKKGFRKWGYLPAIAAVMYVGMFTHQYFFVFAFFLSALVCLYLLINKQWKPLFIFAGAALLAVAVYQIVTRNGIYRLLTSEEGRGGEAVENLLGGGERYFERVRLYLDIVCEHVFAGMNIYIVAALAAGFVILILLTRKRAEAGARTGAKLGTGTGAMELLQKQRTQFLILMGGVCVLYLLMIARIAPYRELRYVFCITPFVSIVFVSLLVNAVRGLGSLGFKWAHWALAACAALYLGLTVSNISDVYLYRGYSRVDERLAPYHSLPVVCVSNTDLDQYTCYWQFFGFEDNVMFTTIDSLSYDATGGTQFDDGLLVLLHPYLDDSDARQMMEALGFGSFTRVTFLVRHVAYYLR